MTSPFYPPPPLPTHAPCALCHHVHRLTERREQREVTYTAACPECRCVCSSSEYDGVVLPSRLAHPAGWGLADEGVVVR